MKSVAELRQECRDALERYREDSRSIVKQSLRAMLPEGIPHWVPPPMREDLARLGLEPQAAVVGRALGVLWMQGRARLVRLEVQRHESDGVQERPLPAVLSTQSADSLCKAAHLALQLYPYPWLLSPRLHLEFRLCNLSGHDVELPEQVVGSSLGLAALVATWSCLCDRPIRDGLIFTGALEDEAVVRVEHVSAKHAEAHEAGALLLLPASNLGDVRHRDGVQLVSGAGEVLTVAFGADWNSPERCPLPPKRDVALMFERLDLNYRNNGDSRKWPELGLLFESFSQTPTLPKAKRLRALARAVACRTHCANLARGTLIRLQTELEAMSPEELDGPYEIEARTHLAMAYRDAYLFEAAIREAKAGWNLGKRLRLHREAQNARSTLGQILVGMGLASEGLEHVREVRAFYEERGSNECPRNHTYVVDALSRLGSFQEAEAEYRLGLRHNEERNNSLQRKANRVFLDYAFLNGRLRCLRRQGDASGWASLREASRKALENESTGWPRMGLERIHDAATLRCEPQSSERERILTRAVERLCQYWQQPLFQWQQGMVLLEYVLDVLTRNEGMESAVTWARNGLRTLPSRQAWRFLNAGRMLRATSEESLRHAVLSCLEGEQY
jgi:tetratricopeptide (TPR) repeat protein